MMPLTILTAMLIYLLGLVVPMYLWDYRQRACHLWASCADDRGPVSPYRLAANARAMGLHG